ncbi:hypothetical protein C7S14_0248 [Burkholderia cepacia]|nr:hypothetical protein C7S14_0248 [Burkholderia cepacia]
MRAGSLAVMARLAACEGGSEPNGSIQCRRWPAGIARRATAIRACFAGRFRRFRCFGAVVGVAKPAPGARRARRASRLSDRRHASG